MFEYLTNYKKIIVSGPQRSGTRICAKIIAEDTGYQYIDETAIKIDNEEAFFDLIKNEEKFVIQCPAMSYCLERLPKDVLVVFMKRDVNDIIKSQERINWKMENWELKKYGKVRGVISQIKYDKWEEQKKNLNYKEVEFMSLKEHPLFIESRDKFRWNQTK